MATEGAIPMEVSNLTGEQRTKIIPSKKQRNSIFPRFYRHLKQQPNFQHFHVDFKQFMIMGA